MKCFCGEPAVWIVAVAAARPSQIRAESACAACDGHIGLVARDLVAEQGNRPRHSYRLVLRGPETPSDIELFTCPACGGRSCRFPTVAEAFCGHCKAWTWPPPPPAELSR